MNKDNIHELLRSGTFEGIPLKGKLIETHISWVILTRKYAFKIKKPLQFSFLDFSTLEKRAYYCRKELTLNRRLTSIYLDVLPITCHDRRFHINGKRGEVTGYTIYMKRLQSARKMDNLLLQKKVSATHMKTLASTIANFHKTADIIFSPFSKEQAKKDFNDILTIRERAGKQLGEHYISIIEQATQNSDSFLDENEKLINDRIEKGLQRDGHGDLHSKNIFLYKNPVIFDCIEFNDAFRQIDILNELAFFCMDLEAYGQSDLSKIFMEYYLDIFPCMNTSEEEKLFIYYKSYRANIRAKVNILRAAQTSQSNEEKRHLEGGKKYLEILKRYTDLLR